SPKPHASHHARVRGQFAILFADENARKVLPYSRARVSANIPNSRSIARRSGCLGLSDGGICLRLAVRPARCAFEPSCGDHPLAPTSAPNATGRWTAGWGSSTPRGSPPPDPPPPGGQGKLRPFRGAPHRLASLTYPKHPDMHRHFVIFFFQ